MQRNKLMSLEQVENTGRRDADATAYELEPDLIPSTIGARRRSKALRKARPPSQTSQSTITSMDSHPGRTITMQPQDQTEVTL